MYLFYMYEGLAFYSGEFRGVVVIYQYWRHHSIETRVGQLKYNIQKSWHSLLAANFVSKGHLDECLVITNAKGQYDGGRVGKKGNNSVWPIVCHSHASSHSL